MSQASTPIPSGIFYFMGNRSVVRLSLGQWDALNREGIVDVEDLKEYEDDDIDNVFYNLRRPQDLWHPTIPFRAGSAEVPADNAATPPVAFQAAVPRRES